MKIGGLVENTRLVLYRITALSDRPGAAGAALRIFAQYKINLEYITESSTDEGKAVLAFCISEKDEERVDQILSENAEFAQTLRIQKTDNISMIGIYGPHFREKPAIAAKFCLLIGKAGVNILGISSSISSICCVVDTDNLETARKSVLSEFELP